MKWGWNSFKASFLENYHYLTSLVVSSLKDSTCKAAFIWSDLEPKLTTTWSLQFTNYEKSFPQECFLRTITGFGCLRMWILVGQTTGWPKLKRGNELSVRTTTDSWKSRPCVCSEKTWKVPKLSFGTYLEVIQVGQRVRHSCHLPGWVLKVHHNTEFLCKDWETYWLQVSKEISV